MMVANDHQIVLMWILRQRDYRCTEITFLPSPHWSAAARRLGVHGEAFETNLLTSHVAMLRESISWPHGQWLWEFIGTDLFFLTKIWMAMGNSKCDAQFQSYTTLCGNSIWSPTIEQRPHERKE